MLASEIARIRNLAHLSLLVIIAWLLQGACGMLAAQSPPGLELQPAVPSLLKPALPSESQRLTQAEEARLLLERALLTGVWGPSVDCVIGQEITYLDRHLFGSGLYARGRSGFGEMKMSLKIVGGDHLNILEQVSDGRMLHVSQTIDGVTEGRRVDLGRVREYLGRFTEQDRTDPLVALHLAIGGQNEKLRALCQQYHWTTVQPGKLSRPGKVGDIDVWWLRGERTTSAPPALRGAAEIDTLLSTADGAGLAPDRATIALGRTPPLQYWLYHVEETRSPKAGEGAGRSLVAKIDYYQPVIRAMPPNMFTYDPEVYASSVERMIDETRKYVPPTRSPASQTAALPQ